MSVNTSVLLDSRYKSEDKPVEFPTLVFTKKQYLISLLVSGAAFYFIRGRLASKQGGYLGSNTGKLFLALLPAFCLLPR
jgi:hypothetical protein